MGKYSWKGILNSFKNKNYRNVLIMYAKYESSHGEMAGLIMRACLNENDVNLAERLFKIYDGEYVGWDS
jgi:hypothetical protein